MSNRTIQIDDRLYAYLLANSSREDALLKRLRVETARMPMSMMQIAPEQGQFMALLAELIGARNAIEVGTFTGYSAISVARVLQKGGKLICCDISEEYTAVARRYWTEAGLADRIELRLAPAVETLDALLARGDAGRFDFGFIDADKENYDAYYERVLRLLRPGGLVTIDNVLWDGKVADLTVRDSDDVDTAAIRRLNAKLLTDQRISLSLVPIGDGLTLARKR
jgi:caffeoyl-CoA O-methyltransferase